MSESPAARNPELPANLTLSWQICASVWAVIAIVAAASLYLFHSYGLTNIYGDAMAHMEGARRIFDSLTPGYAEIGTVWLPLFHLLAAPLALNDFLWRTGLAGSIVSTSAFMLAAWLLFRLAFEMNGNLAAAFGALAGFLISPNMLYLAGTPLTEPLTILWTVLTVAGLFRYQQQGGRRALVGAAVAAFLGTLTRYDGWALLPFVVLFLLVARRDSWPARLRAVALFLLVAGAGPLLWLLHNAYRFGNPIEFYNGAYSAQAIYARQLATTGFHYPTDGSWVLATRYYLADLVLVIGIWPLALAILGIVAWLRHRRLRARRAAALLLLVPFPFYVHSMAHAAVPLYVPTLFPHAYYNLRYGLEMLPAVALLASFLLSSGLPRRVRHAALLAVIAALVFQGVSLVRHGAEGLAVAREGILNNPCRAPRQQAVIRVLREGYDGSRVLVSAGKWSCVMPALGIPFRNTVSETNRPQWRSVREAPDPWAGWILRGEGDTVDELMRAHPERFQKFELIFEEDFGDGGRATIYRLRRE